MDSRITTTSRPDIMMVESAARPTPAPSRVSFGQVLAAGANGLVQGAELAVSNLPGSPLTAAAIRGGSSVLSLQTGALSTNAPEGPGISPSTGLPLGTGLGMSLSGSAAAGSTSTGAASATGTDPSSSIDASLQQSAELNMYYLQVQEQVDAQNRSFTALSNVLKTEHDSAKAAIQNIHS